MPPDLYQETLDSMAQALFGKPYYSLSAVDQGKILVRIKFYEDQGFPQGSTVDLNGNSVTINYAPPIPNADRLRDLMRTNPELVSEADVIDAYIGEGYTPEQAQGLARQPSSGLTDGQFIDRAARFATGEIGLPYAPALNEEGVPSDSSLLSIFRAYIKDHGGRDDDPAAIDEVARDMLASYKEALKGEAGPKTAADYAAEFDALKAQTQAALDQAKQGYEEMGAVVTQTGDRLKIQLNGRTFNAQYVPQRGRVEASDAIMDTRFVPGIGATNPTGAAGVPQTDAANAARLATGGIANLARELISQGIDPNVSNIQAYLGTSFSPVANPDVAFNQQVQEAMPGRSAPAIANTSGEAERRARFTAAAEQAFPINPWDSPELQQQALEQRQRYVDVNMETARLLAAPQGTTPLSQVEETVFGQVGNGAVALQDGQLMRRVFGGGAPSGEARLEPFTQIQLQNAATAGDPRFDARLDDLGRNFSLSRSAGGGFFITGPDGRQHGPFATVQDAEAWQSRLALDLYRSQQRGLEARQGNRFSGGPNVGLGPNPARPRLNTPDAGDRPPVMQPPPVSPPPPQQAPQFTQQQVSPTTFVGAPVYQQVPVSQVATAFGGSNPAYQSVAQATAPVQAPAFEQPRRRRRQSLSVA